LDTLKYFTLISYSTYCSSRASNITNYTCFWCKQVANYTQIKVRKTFYSSTYDEFGIVLETNENIIVAFRGTILDIKNWLADLSIVQEDYPNCDGCTVHQGFYNSYLNLKPKFFSYVQQLQSKTQKNIIVTGHSLGAALGSLCAADLFQANLPVSLITFGQPRVGNSNFASWYAGLGYPIWRVTNERDIVPHVPFRFFQYEHFPREIWFQNNYVNFQKCSKSNGEDPNCSDDGFDDSIEDHLYYLGYYQRAGIQHNCD